MNTSFAEFWRKLSRSKEYRAELVGSLLKRGTSLQIRGLRKGLSQQQAAERAGITQGVLSRAEDPDYGNLTLNTIIRIAAGYDVAFIGRFVPFSEFAKWAQGIPEGGISYEIPSFEEESGKVLEKLGKAATALERGRGQDASSMRDDLGLTGKGKIFGALSEFQAA